MQSANAATSIIETPEVHTGLVSAQLRRVLQSQHFADAPRLSRFLTYVVEQHLAGHASRLKGYNIAIEVFDRPADFDPVTDTIVRVQAGQLRRRLERYYANEGCGDPLRIEVPRGTYAPMFALPGLAPVPLTSPSSDVERPLGAKPRDLPSVAVVPFTGVCSSPGAQQLGEALSAEIVVALARFRHLSVFSRLAMGDARSHAVDTACLHERLNADLVLGGTFRQTDTGISVSYELADASTAIVEFSDRLQRSSAPDELCHAVDEMALWIAARVADRHGPVAGWRRRGRVPASCEPWDAYNRAMRHHLLEGVHLRAANRQAHQGLRSALDAEPEWSDGWAALAIVRLDEHRYGLDAADSVSALEEALRHARQAVACDPGNAAAHGALALVHHFRREEADFRVAAHHAVSLNPADAQILANAGLCHYLRGERSEGLELVQRAIALAPLDPGWHRYPLAIELALRGDFESALQEIRMATSPGLFVHHACVAWFSAGLGAWLEAAKANAALLALHPGFNRNARALLARWCVHPSLSKPIVAGLRLAGLAIKD